MYFLTSLKLILKLLALMYLSQVNWIRCNYAFTTKENNFISLSSSKNANLVTLKNTKTGKYIDNYIIDNHFSKMIPGFKLSYPTVLERLKIVIKI